MFCYNTVGVFCTFTAVPSGVVLAVAQKTRRAGHFLRGAQHLESLQSKELLPVSLQRRAHCHQEKEVSNLSQLRQTLPEHVTSYPQMSIKHFLKKHLSSVL